MVSTLDVLVARWSGLVVAIGLLLGLIAFSRRERTRGATRSVRVLVGLAILCAILAVLGRAWPLLR